MTQEAKIFKLLPDNMAEVVVIRGTACGSNCGNCESCIYQNELHTEAFNKANAVLGDRVIIESKSSVVYKAAVLVYIFPIIMLVAGYAFSAALGASEGLCVLISFLSLLISVAVIVFTQKNKPNIGYNIIRVVEEDDDID